MKTELGMKIKSTPLMAEIEEYLALLDDKKLLLKRIEQQKVKVLFLMRENKVYNLKVGNLEVLYEITEEKHNIKVKKKR